MVVNCVVYRRGEKIAEIPVDQIRSHLAADGCFIWVALREPDVEELEFLKQEFDLHELAVQDALNGHQRPKLEEYGSLIFVVLRTVEAEGAELLEGEVAVFVGPRFVVSVRRHTRQGFADVRSRTELEPDLLRHGPPFVLYTLMDAIVDRYFPVVDALADEIEQVEDRIFSGETTRAQVEALYGLKRKVATLEHAAGPLLEVTGKLYGGRVPAGYAGLHEYFRDIHDHLLRLQQATDKLRETVSTSVSVNLSLITLQENEVTKRLASYAALVAVPTLVAGIYGMNFEYMPELRSPFGYPLALLAMVAIDGYLVFRFRKARWL